MITADLSQQSESVHPTNGPAYLPTPEEIAAECWVIRASWTEAEAIRRRVAIPHDLQLIPSHESIPDQRE